MAIQANWAEVNAIFCDWVDLPEYEQAALLKVLSSSDPEKADLVGELLKADRGTSVVKTIDFASVLEQLETEEDSIDWIGQELGPYRIEGFLGSGGMGDVYLGRHKNYQGLAAVKILARSSSPERRARFESEKQLLGRLNHSGIAGILHADSHSNGSLFFAMEYVKGLPVTTYCDDQKLTLHQRMRLFEHVCAAVQAAHSSGVVHRDLKPSNILVTGQGIVKLLDFGIAEEADAVKLIGTRFMSAPYSSPEYEESAPTVTADIYSLGTILYEMVASRLPFEIEGCTVPEIRARIHQGNLPRVSSLCPVERRGQLSSIEWAELDSICTKATATSHEQRYITAESLQRDLAAVLDGQTIPMAAPPALYRTRKFARRHRFASVAVPLTASMLIATVAVYTWRLNKERNRAAAAAQHAQKLVRFDREMFDFVQNDSGPAKSLTAVGMIDRSVPLVDRIGDDPETQIELYTFIASDYIDLGEYDKAETVLQHGMLIAKKAFGSDSEQAGEILKVMSQLRGAKGQTQESETLAEQAYAIDSRRFKPGDRNRLEAEEVLAQARIGLNKNREAIQIEQSHLNHLTGDPDLDLLSDAYNTIGLAELNLGHSQQALIANRQSLEIDTRLFGKTNPNIAGHYMTIASIEQKSGDSVSARRDYQLAVDTYTNWFGASDPHTADAQVALAECLTLSGNAKEALPLLQVAVPVEKKLWGENTPEVARANNAFGMTEEKLGHLPQARAYFSKALAAYETLYPTGSVAVATVQYHLATVDSEAHHLALAESEARASVATSTKAVGGEDRYTLRDRLELGRILRAEHRDSEAAQIFRSVCGEDKFGKSEGAHSEVCKELADHAEKISVRR